MHQERMFLNGLLFTDGTAVIGTTRVTLSENKGKDFTAYEKL